MITLRPKRMHWAIPKRPNATVSVRHWEAYICEGIVSMETATADRAEAFLRKQAPPPPAYAHDTAHYSQIAAGERERRLRAERRARGWRTAALYSTAIALGIHGTKALALWAIGVALALVVLAVWLNVTETEEQR